MNRLQFFSKSMIFGAVFIIGIIVMSGCTVLLSDADIGQRTQMLIVSSVQNIVAFAFPTIVVVLTEGLRPGKMLGLDGAPSIRSIVGICVAFLCGTIFLNQIIIWNEQIVLPASMSGFEHEMRQMESIAQEHARIILSTHSITGLCVNILVVAILTGFGEEMFFRGGIQRLLCSITSKHVAIWIAAVIFSAMHFQFYGFLPRILLGAFFGYLYVWTGNLWVPIIAHALNNTTVVISEWLNYNGISDFNPDSLPGGDSGFNYLSVVSIMAFSIFIYYRKFWFSTSKQ